jgi:hypothetical protein
MAVSDDLNRLAAEDVVYLTRTYPSTTGFQRGASTEVFRGRLRQALNGDWVFNASTGQNGVVGFVLGSVGTSWNSSESPATGIQVTIRSDVILALLPLGLAPLPPTNPILEEVIVLTTVIPSVFTD